MAEAKHGQEQEIAVPTEERAQVHDDSVANTEDAIEAARLAQVEDYLERCRIARECGVW